MIIGYRDDVAWIVNNDDPTPDERQVLLQFTEALPDAPSVIRINNLCEYVKMEGGEFCDRSKWVEYYFNVQGETPLPRD